MEELLLMKKKTLKDLKMINDNGKAMKNFQVEALYGIQETTQLNQLYFSKANMNEIQAGIRYYVYIKTDKKHIIDKQSEVELVGVKTEAKPKCNFSEANFVELKDKVYHVEKILWPNLKS